MNIMQILHDHGLNPFAARLLAESYTRHPGEKVKVQFPILGVLITLEPERPLDQEQKPE